MSMKIRTVKVLDKSYDPTETLFKISSILLNSGHYNFSPAAKFKVLSDSVTVAA